MLNTSQNAYFVWNTLLKALFLLKVLEELATGHCLILFAMIQARTYLYPTTYCLHSPQRDTSESIEKIFVEEYRFHVTLRILSPKS